MVHVPDFFRENLKLASAEMLCTLRYVREVAPAPNSAKPEDSAMHLAN
jgi:hypothetical protein